MPVPRLVVVGASSGGIETLRTLVGGLPPDFAAPLCVVLHTSPQSSGVLDVILNRAGVLPVITPTDRERLQPGRIYVAPPDRHLLVEPGILRITRGPKENCFRPAIDPLFRSAAQVYGPAVIGVVLSGSLDDGTAGLRVIKQLGGMAVVQDPDDALFPGMPQSALRHVDVDYVLRVAELPALLVRLAHADVAVPARTVVPTEVEVEVKIAKENPPLDAGLGEIGEPSPFACPECHGVLLRLKNAVPARFRCHTGHAYSPDSLIAGLNENIDDSLWTSIRALQEGALVLEHLQQHLREQGNDDAALGEQIARAREQVDALRHVVNERAGLMTSAEVVARHK
jgi:two-component system, chemotaxis family, protein-glutamate methylesterase/glutaminase